jgi:glycerol-3-phosphate dehydrogenase
MTHQPAHKQEDFDLVVIGGGVNGCGIARDAAGRGLKVLLCEKNDLASATSSAATKLFHGGLRYLEFFEFRLVREALIEREVLLRAMPHISWPLRFVLPYDPALQYPSDASRLATALRYTMPWLRGRRPAWLVRLGLFIYDHLGGRDILPGTRTLDLRASPVGKPLDDRYKKAFEYSDCWVQDSRLVVLNAQAAAGLGAEILTQTECVTASRVNDTWEIQLRDNGDKSTRTVRARGLVNAGGPWVSEVLSNRLHQNSKHGVRLVRGSHIVTRKLFDHDQPYFFQLSDGRIIFAIPYETDFTLIGTTDQDHRGDPGNPVCTQEEKQYLLKAIAANFTNPPGEQDIVWSYSGVRPLYDDNASSATAATRDYVLKISDENGDAPLLSIFGGKLTTYRRLAESALKKLAPYFPQMGPDWTAGAPLPGGDFAHDGVDDLISQLLKQFPFLNDAWASRLIRAYGTQAFELLAEATSVADLGVCFGWDLYQREVVWLREKEWAKSADDILWRRSKLGLRLTIKQAEALKRWLEDAGDT